jgi:hypothetical protein
MKNEHARFRQMKKDLGGLRNKHLAEATGNTVNGIKNATQPNRPLPRNLCYSILVHEWHNGGRKGTFKDFIKANK